MIIYGNSIKKMTITVSVVLLQTLVRFLREISTATVQLCGLRIVHAVKRTLASTGVSGEAK